MPDGIYSWAAFPVSEGMDILGILRFEATNLNGETGIGYSHDLDNLRAIPLAANIQFSHDNTTPLISWDPVYYDDDGSSATPDVEVEQYWIRIYNELGQEIFRDYDLDNPNYLIPLNLLQAGSLYHFRILAINLDIEGGVPYTENRSSTFTTFYTLWSNPLFNIPAS